MSLAMVEPVKHSEFIGIRNSELWNHGKCCEIAKQWLVTMHRSQSFSRSERQTFHAPTWLKRHYQWGPVQWPLSWCEAVQKKQIDCGVFAAFTIEIMRSCYGSNLVSSDKSEETSRDLAFNVYPAQIILEQPATYIDQWNSKWAGIAKNYQWIGERNVYHEVVAVSNCDRTEIRIYDPTEGIWLEPNLQHGINGVIGVCVLSPKMLNWGHFRFGQSHWVVL